MLYGSGSSTKKGTVDVHRGGESHSALMRYPTHEIEMVETYQFAYFLRKSVPHAVVMKVSFLVF